LFLKGAGRAKTETVERYGRKQQDDWRAWGWSTEQLDISEQLYNRRRWLHTCTDRNKSKQQANSE